MGQFFAQLASDMAGGPITAAAVEDALTVLAALIYARAPLTADQLAAALGWPMDRVTCALNAAEQHPDLAGPIAVQRTESATYIITARLDRLSSPQRQALRPSSGSCEAMR
jgi:hypothetical protein